MCSVGIVFKIWLGVDRFTRAAGLSGLKAWGTSRGGGGGDWLAGFRRSPRKGW